MLDTNMSWSFLFLVSFLTVTLADGYYGQYVPEYSGKQLRPYYQGFGGASSTNLDPIDVALNFPNGAPSRLRPPYWQPNPGYNPILNTHGNTPTTPKPETKRLIIEHRHKIEFIKRHLHHRKPKEDETSVEPKLEEVTEHTVVKQPKPQTVVVNSEEKKVIGKKPVFDGTDDEKDEEEDKPARRRLALGRKQISRLFSNPK